MAIHHDWRNERKVNRKKAIRDNRDQKKVNLNG